MNIRKRLIMHEPSILEILKTLAGLETKFRRISLLIYKIRF